MGMLSLSDETEVLTATSWAAFIVFGMEGFMIDSVNLVDEDS